MKPKIAVILPNSLPIPPIKGGSIQTVVYDVLKRLSGLQIETYSRRLKGLPARQLDEYGILHHYLWDSWYDSLELETKKGFLLRYNRYIYRIIKKIKKSRPDLIHVHNRPHYLPVLRYYFPQTALIYTGHNLKIAEDIYNYSRIELIGGSIDRAIYCSKRVGELDLWNAHPQYKDKVSTIYNAVDTDLYLPAEQQDGDILSGLRKKYELEDKKIVLFVGRLVEEKAAHNVLHAIKKLIVDDPELMLLMVGSSFFEGAKKTDYVRYLETLAAQIKQNVRFTGFVKPLEMPYIYALADVFVSPVNWDDPSPKTIYEAASCQLPIISTKRGGIPEIVIDGHSAILLDSPYEIEQLAEQIAAVLHDHKLAVELGINARKRMLGNFTIDRISGQWQKAYLQTIADNTTARIVD